MDNMEKNSENKTIKAIGLAVLMGLIGCAIYIGIYLIGYIAFIGAYFIYYFSANGYKKVCGRIDNKGYWAIAIISFVELMISSLIGEILFSAIRVEMELGLVTEIIIEYYFTSASGIGEFFGGNIIAIIFLVIAAFSFKRKEKKNNPEIYVNDFSGNTTNSNNMSTNSSQMTTSGTVVNDFTVNKTEDVNTTVNESENYQDTDYNDYNASQNDYEQAQTVEDLFKDLDDGTNNF